MNTLQQFLVDGFLEVTPSELNEADHDGLYQAAEDIYAEAAATKSKTLHLDLLGDTALRGRIPAIENILSDPKINETLETLLGADYFVHPHMFLHQASTGDQPFHQDGNLPWNERGHYRPHRCDWALMFYYPQAVTLENGPTEIVPGSQYWTKDIERADGTWHAGDSLDRSYRDDGVVDSPNLDYRDQRNSAALESLCVPNLERKFVTVPKGTAVICNYDIIHRGSRQTPEQPARYMYKFYFARTRSPETGKSVVCPENIRSELKPVVQHCLDWQRGQPTTAHESTFNLHSAREDERVAGAYELGAAGAIDELTLGLTHDREAVRRASAYGLRAMGPEYSDVILNYLDSAHDSTRRFALFALGNAENATNSDVVSALIRAIQEEPDDLARSNAAYALGQISRGPLADPDRVYQIVAERLLGDQEPDNTEVALLPRSTVRQSLAYTALQLATNHQLSELPGIDDLVADRDRYVRGFMQEVNARQS